MFMCARAPRATRARLRTQVPRADRRKPRPQAGERSWSVDGTGTGSLCRGITCAQCGNIYVWIQWSMEANTRIIGGQLKARARAQTQRTADQGWTRTRCGSAAAAEAVGEVAASERNNERESTAQQATLRLSLGHATPTPLRARSAWLQTCLSVATLLFVSSLLLRRPGPALRCASTACRMTTRSTPKARNMSEYMDDRGRTAGSDSLAASIFADARARRRVGLVWEFKRVSHG